MKAKTTNNKASAKKKLIPAAGSLAISAVMLASSTYAWFTMSREVEVQNIQMTATVPEDIQISLGKIYTNGSTDVSTTNATSLAYGTGWLKESGGEAEAPRDGNTAYNSIDWSNTADISHYYRFGRLIPASSDTGEDIFFTPDANGIGQTVKVGARYFQAADGLNATLENGIASGTASGTFKATSHINAMTETGAWATGSGTGTRSTDWNDTKDDGYYIDIPVWLRTSSTEGADVKVKAYVIDRNPITPYGTDTSGTATGKELYRAVRVAILTDGGATAAASGTGNLIQVKDGGQEGENLYNSGTILDWYNPASQTSGTNPMKVYGGAVSSINNQGDTNPTYTLVDTLNGSKLYDGEKSVAHLNAGSGNVYGDATKVIIRVWLEGEDPDCYNETAGQDWSINLMFEKV